MKPKNNEQTLIGKTEDDARKWCETRLGKPKCTIVPHGCCITMQVRVNELLVYLGPDGLIEDVRFYSV